MAELLGDAPIVTSEGRVFSLTIRYHDLGFAKTGDLDMAEVIQTLMEEEKGSLLAFLPGGGEITRLAEQLKARKLAANISIHQLYGAMPLDQQRRAIEPTKGEDRKIVLATNIAETSLTIEGIRMVVDCGLRRALRFDPNSGMGRLQKVKISKASADQRAGRAGRTEAGLCYRMWREEETRSLLDYDAPEIAESDLADLVMELKAWGVDQADGLKWMTTPPKGHFDQAQDLLENLDILDNVGKITGFGKRAAKLPVHPRFAAMILRAKDINLGWVACLIAALLSERDFLLKSRDGDLSKRIRMLLQNPSGLAINRGQFEKVKQLGKQIARLASVDTRSKEAFDPYQVGLILAFGYPDRIARRRPGQDTYHMTGGRGAQMDHGDELSAAEYITVCDLDGAGRNARIYRAAMIAERDIEEYFQDHIYEEEVTRFVSESRQFVSESYRKLGQLTLSKRKLKSSSPEAVQWAILEHIRKKGLRILPWDKTSKQVKERAIRAKEWMEDPDIPDLSDDALLETLEDWLAPYLIGINSLEGLSQLNLKEILSILIPWDLSSRLDQALPTHLTVPTGSKIPVDYSSADGPVLAVRIQEVFGMKETPTIAMGRIPVTLHLLSPAPSSLGHYQGS